MKKERHKIKLHCDERSHKDVFKCMMDYINRTMGLQSGGYHCHLPQSLGAVDPQYPQPWFAGAPHQPPKSRAGAGSLPHTGMAGWSTPGAADRAGLAGWCCGFVLHVMGRGVGARGMLGVQSCMGTCGHAAGDCQQAAALLEYTLGAGTGLCTC